MKNGKQPAYPIIQDFDKDRLEKMPEKQFKELQGRGNGLTKRERFTMAAMQGILANPNTRVGDSRWPIWLEYTARRIAESQLEELEETNDN